MNMMLIGLDPSPARHFCVLSKFGSFILVGYQVHVCMIFYSPQPCYTCGFGASTKGLTCTTSLDTITDIVELFDITTWLIEAVLFR